MNRPRRLPSAELPHPYATHVLRGNRGERYQVRVVASYAETQSFAIVELCWTGQQATVFRQSLTKIYLEEEE